MRILSMIFVLLFVLSIHAFSQNKEIDVVYMKSGDVYKGKIIENVPNDYIKLEQDGGNIKKLLYADIEKFTKEFIKEKETEDSEGLTSQKMYTYESQKKNPTTGMIFSCLLTSMGHLYAENWGRGLLFTAGEAACIIGAFTLGISDKKTTSGSSYYSYTTTTTELNAGFYAFLALELGLRIWEIVDAGSQVEKYNENLYKKLNKKKNVSMNMYFMPIKKGGSLKFALNF